MAAGHGAADATVINRRGTASLQGHHGRTADRGAVTSCAASGNVCDSRRVHVIPVQR